MTKEKLFREYPIRNNLFQCYRTDTGNENKWIWMIKPNWQKLLTIPCSTKSQGHWTMQWLSVYQVSVVTCGKAALVDNTSIAMQFVAEIYNGFFSIEKYCLKVASQYISRAQVKIHHWSLIFQLKSDQNLFYFYFLLQMYYFCRIVIFAVFLNRLVIILCLSTNFFVHYFSIRIPNFFCYISWISILVMLV